MHFAVTVTIFHPTDWARRAGLSVSVNPRALLSWIPRELAGSLRLPPVGRRTFEAGDGRLIERETVCGVLELEGRFTATTFVVAEPEDGAAIGLVALQSLGFTVHEDQSRIVSQDLLAMTQSPVCEMRYP